jgi:hypothetical protein
MKQLVLCVMAMLCIMANSIGQSALNVKAGILNRQFTDELDSGSSLVHYGLNYGFDFIVDDSWVLFMPGLHYQRYDIDASDSRGSIFRKREHIHQISLPLSLGATVLRSPVSNFRVYGGGHVNFIVGVDKNDNEINLDRVTTVHPGWQAGAQVMLWRFTADLRYYRDYRKVINVRENSELKGWELLIGFAF